MKVSKLANTDVLVGKPNVVVFGTGNFGKIVVQAAIECGLTVEKVCDSNTSNWGTSFCGHPVVSPDELNENDIVLLATNISNRKFLRKLCTDKKISLVYDVDVILRSSSWPSFYDKLDLEWSLDRSQEVIDLYLFDIDSESEEKLLRVKSLDVVLTERCSLKCVDCSNLMQYYQKPIGVEVEVLGESLRNFLEVVNYVSEIRLIGGEPLVSKNIERILDLIYEFSNFDKIVLYTNGTVVPKESLLKKFQDRRVWIKISDYGEVSRKAELVANTCKSWGINCIHEHVTEWEDVGRISFRGRTIAENKVVFGNCCVNDTLTLLHGQLYACPFSAHTDNLGVLKNAEKDKIDMLDQENLQDKIREIYKKKDVLVACNLCNGRDHIVGKVIAGVQTKNPLSLQVYQV